MEQDTTGYSDETQQLEVSPRLQPVQESERIEALDVLRGFALLGIFMVNIQFFSLPLMEGVGHLTLGDASPGEVWGWAFIRTFCELKFVSLFSLLFGMGLVVQMTRAQAKGRTFTMYYLRRTVILAIFGLAHALLLWYGDILFLYACVSLLLFVLCRLSAKTLLGIWIGLVVISLLIATTAVGLPIIIAQIQAAQAAQVQDEEEADPVGELVTEAEPAPAEVADALPENVQDVESPSEDEAGTASSTDDEDASPYRGFEALSQAKFDPSNENWRTGERLAYQEGPFADVFAFRGVSFVYALIGGFFGYGWHVLAMFLLGAAFIKWDFFAAERRPWHRRLFLIGVGAGLAAEFMSTGLFILYDFEIGLWMMAAAALHELGSFTLCLGYVGGLTLLANSGALRRLTRAMACVGRTALSNYISQTVIATGLMYWWGLGWFGEVPRPEMIGLVLAIYVGQLIVSTLWLRLFRIGPLEWLWRSLTYWRRQPMRR